MRAVLLFLLGFSLAATVMAPVDVSAAAPEASEAREADVQYQPAEGPPVPVNQGSEFPGGDGVIECLAIGVTVGAVLVLALVIILTVLAGESLSKATGVELSPWGARLEPAGLGGLGALRHRGIGPPSGLVLLRF